MEIQMVRRWIVSEQVGMVFENARPVVSQQPFAKFARLPPQLKAHDVISKIDCWLSRNLGPDRLRNIHCLLPQLLSSPILLSESAFSQERCSVVRINIAIGSLEEEAQRCRIKCLLHGARHRANKIRRVFKVVGAEYYRVASVVNQYGHWLAIAVIDPHDPN